MIETGFPVRYAETDQMGIVHHSAYVVWFEEGRNQYMRAMGADYAELEAAGVLLVVSEMRIRYLASARFGQSVSVGVELESVRSRSLSMQYQVIESESRNVLVTGWTKLICVDRNGRVVRIPLEWRRILCRDRK